MLRITKSTEAVSMHLLVLPCWGLRHCRRSSVGLVEALGWVLDLWAAHRWLGRVRTEGEARTGRWWYLLSSSTWWLKLGWLLW
jgi:hypothetical protein